MAKQNKPAIRFKGFTDAWEQRKAKDLCSISTGKSNTQDRVDDGIYPFYVRSPIVEHSNRYLFDEEAVLTVGDGVGTGKVFHYVNGKYDLHQRVYRMFDFSEEITAKYFYYYFSNHFYDRVMAMTAKTSVDSVRYEMIADMDIALPKVKEQMAISAYFDRLDHLITLHQRKYDKLQVLKKAMLEKMFPKNGSSVPEIRFKGFTDAWEQRKLGELVDRVVRKNTNNESTLPLTISAQYGLVDQITYFNNRVASRDVSNYYLVLNGEFAYNKSTSDGYPFGAVKRLDLYEKGVLSTLYIVFVPKKEQQIDSDFLTVFFDTNRWHKGVAERAAEGARNHGLLNISAEDFFDIDLSVPKDVVEQKQIGAFIRQLDDLITLHQRKPYSHIQRRCNMLNEAQRTDKFCEYYAKWITVYKKGAIRQVTMDKYLMTQKWLEKLIPDLKICDLNRIAYQQLLNDYAEYHERQTTMDFHHQLKGAVLDAVDEGLIDRDPTRKAIIKGKAPSTKKIKYLNQFELHTLLASLELKDEVNWDYFILLVAKTGMRFSEALALTPKDFDFYHQTLSISKTWDYKGAGGFQPTKNKSSVRKIQIDWQSVIRFSELVKGLPDDQPIFVDGKVYNSTVNDVLSRHCERCNIPVISIHGLRHTHASLLLFTGVSIASVARRLGHSSMTTTQKTYLHIIQELENKDIDLVMRSLSGLN